MILVVLQLRTILKTHGIQEIQNVPMVRIMTTTDQPTIQMTSAVPVFRTTMKQIQSPSVRTDLIMITTDS